MLKNKYLQLFLIYLVNITWAFIILLPRSICFLIGEKTISYIIKLIPFISLIALPAAIIAVWQIQKLSLKDMKSIIARMILISLFYYFYYSFFDFMANSLYSLSNQPYLCF